MKIGDIVQEIVDKCPNGELTITTIPPNRVHFSLRYSLYDQKAELIDVKQLQIGAYHICSRVEMEQMYLNAVYTKEVSMSFICDVDNLLKASP